VRRFVGLELGGVLGVLGGVKVMTVREMRVMSALLLVALVVMLSRVTVMLCRFRVVLGSLFVMLGYFRCVHSKILGSHGPDAPRRQSTSAR
jgi:hypothetical protein